MTLQTTTLNHSLTLALRGMFAAALAATVAACSGAPMSPTSPTAQVASEEGTQAKGGGSSVPAVFGGVWIQNPVMVIPQPGGGVANAWVRLSLTQKDSTITGEARRFLSSWDANGNPLLVALDQGSPGKVTGTASATGMSIVIRDFLETKLTLSMAFAISADGSRLTATSGTPNSLQLQSLTR